VHFYAEEGVAAGVGLRFSGRFQSGSAPVRKRVTMVCSCADVIFLSLTALSSTGPRLAISFARKSASETY